MHTDTFGRYELVRLLVEASKIVLHKINTES